MRKNLKVNMKGAKNVGYVLLVAIVIVTSLSSVSATVLWEEGFESGVLDSNVTTSGNGKTAVATTSSCGDGNNPCGATHQGTYQLEMDCDADSSCGGWRDNIFQWVGFDLYDKADLDFSFYYKDHGDEAHRCPRSVLDLANANCDGAWVQCSYEDGNDKTIWYLMESLITSPSGSWIFKDYDLSASAPELCRSPNYRPYSWAITQFDNYAIKSETYYDGFTIDDMVLEDSSSVAEDFLLDVCQDITVSGTYNITTGITGDVSPCFNILVDNVEINGFEYSHNAETSLYKPILFQQDTGVDNISIHDIAHTVSVGTQKYYGVVSGKLNENCVYTDFNIRDMATNIFTLTSPHNTTIANNTLYYDYKGIYISAPTSELNIINNEFEAGADNNYGIYLTTATKFNISDNYMEKGINIYLLSTGVAPTNDRLILNNEIITSNTGIKMNAAHFVNVKHNSFNDMGSYSVNAYTSGSSNVFYNNTFEGTSEFRFNGVNDNWVFNNAWYDGLITTDTTNNYWNTILTCGDGNIIGGDCLGGNYYHWNDPCIDADLNGICDDPYTHSTNNVDNYPLGFPGDHAWFMALILILLGFGLFLIFWAVKLDNDHNALSLLFIVTGFIILLSLVHITSLMSEYSITGSYSTLVYVIALSGMVGVILWLKRLLTTVN
jgi:hypothetical protein